MSKIDVMMVTYNKANYLSQAIESVLAQKGHLLNKIIINDDCSTDNTIDVIKSYTEKYPDIIEAKVNLENYGIFKNVRIGINRVTAPYTCFLACDDFYCDNEKLIKQMKYMEENNNVIGVCGYMQEVNENGVASGVLQPDPILISNLKYFDLLKLYKNYPVIPLGALLVKSAIIKECYLPEFDYTLPDDTSTSVFLAQKGLIGFIPEILYSWRKYNESTWTDELMIKKIIYDIQTRLRLRKYVAGEYAEMNNDVINDHCAYFNHLFFNECDDQQRYNIYEFIIGRNDERLVNFLLGD